MTEAQDQAANLAEHQKTYRGFLKFGKIVAMASIGVLLFLALYNS